MSEASRQFRDQLRTYLHGVDLDQLTTVHFDWSYINDPLTTTATYLKDNVPVAKSVGGEELSSALATNFTHTAGHLHDRASKIKTAASSLDSVNTALSNALKDQAAWDANPLTAPTAPDKTDPKYDQTGADGKPVNDYNADQATYNTQNSTYQTQSGDREQQAQQHIQKIDAAMTTAITAMKDIHQQPDNSSTPSGTPGAPAGGTAPLPTGPVAPLPTGTHPPHSTTPTGTPTPVPVGSTGHHPVGTGGSGGGGGWGGPGSVAPPHGGGGGWGGPSGGGGGGSTWNGSDPLVGTSSESGFPGGVGLGAAVLGGGLIAGAGGVAGLRALGGTLGSEEAGLGMSARSGGPGVLGKGGGAALEEEGASGGRSGAGGMGGRGAGGGAGGRGRGKGKKRRDGEHGDLWDDGEDWIDDEGAAPGVLS